ncbi:hypothetical protein JHK86_010650 [Glycine max]|nr:hypothetical protein JHK86_010650 [Glycine max]
MIATPVVTCPITNPRRQLRSPPIYVITCPITAGEYPITYHSVTTTYHFVITFYPSSISNVTVSVQPLGHPRPPCRGCLPPHPKPIPMTTQTLEMTTKTLEMTAKLDVILDRLSAPTPTPFYPNSSPTDAPPPVETLTIEPQNTEIDLPSLRSAFITIVDTKKRISLSPVMKLRMLKHASSISLHC